MWGDEMIAPTSGNAPPPGGPNDGVVIENAVEVEGVTGEKEEGETAQEWRRFDMMFKFCTFKNGVSQEQDRERRDQKVRKEAARELIDSNDGNGGASITCSEEVDLPVVE